MNSANYLDNVKFTGLVTGTTLTTQAGGWGEVTYVYAPIPEPGTYALMLAGLVGLGLRARRKT